MVLPNDVKKISECDYFNWWRTALSDIDIKKIQEIIDKTSEETEEKIDWTKAWGKKYPILLKYQSEVNVPNYARRINIMLRLYTLDDIVNYK